MHVIKMYVMKYLKDEGILDIGIKQKKGKL